MKHFIVSTALCLIVLGATGSIAGAPPQPGRLDLAKLRDLPVRFNGRVTTWASVAGAYAAQVAGQGGLVGEDVELRWMLDVWLKPEVGSAVPVLPIGDAELRELMNGEPRAGAAGNAVPRYSLVELKPAFGKLDAEALRAARTPAAGRTQFDRAVLELHRRVIVMFALIDSSREVGPARVDPADADAVASGNRELLRRELAAAPMPVPPEEPGAGWQTIARLGFEMECSRMTLDRLQGTRPAAAALSRCVLAYAVGDQAALDRHADEFRRAFAAATGIDDVARRGALDFAAPADWVQTGARVGPHTAYYSDSRAFGRAVAMFDVPGAGGAAAGAVTVRIDHFTAAIAPLNDVVNAWRYNQRELPAPAGRVTEHVRGIALHEAGADPPRCAYVDITGAPGVFREPPDRSLSVIVRRGPHTFVVSMYGPAAEVGRHAPAFDGFVKSLRFGTPQELSAWLRAEAPKPMPLASLQAVVRDRDGGRAWCARLVAPNGPIDHRREAFAAFARSLRVDNGLLKWDALPAGWTLGDFTERTLVTFLAGNEHTRDTFPVEVVALSAKPDDSLLPMVNLWRATSGLAPLDSEQQLESAFRRVGAAGRDVLLLELRPEPGVEARE